MKNKELRKEPSAQELLKIIFKYINLIANERDVDRLLIALADMGRDLITADRCTVWLVNQQRGELWSKIAHGVDRIVIPLSKGVAGYVATTGKSMITNDAYADERFDKQVDSETGYRTRSIIALPIRDSAGEVMGVYQAINKMSGEDGFTERDLEHLQLAASYTGSELEAVTLQEEIEQTQREMIVTLAEAGEMRSKETGGHVRRVAEYSYLIALAMGMDAKEAELLKKASPMHDIGKIAIPDAILLKEGPLTDEEREVMKSHTAIGYDMLKYSTRDLLKTSAIVAYQHHEKWDGSGYPQGLVGEEIHIYGRITAVADVFDALSCDRVYKAAWPRDKIVALFKEERGRHFDPALCDIMDGLWDQLYAIKGQYSH
ncbi:HD domain-containing phosphohydrolase [Sediminispirochaeta bajacaliforniensis]|uniref:HD domain-containing phosphohydrolase n=1 Tax=Sediminispirochaeta bajacaliforniensis TaxID=148 RepID=UPI000378ED1A|nr:HD domain-containing phosphohydrolase [Sediminispirochaeta bajacaliforniensis]